MATTPQTAYEPPAGAPSELQEKARRHLWMHFTRMGAYDEDHEIPIIVRGEGCYVYDEHGKRYLDGLSALFCVNAGHGRAELGDAAAAQAKELGFFTELELRAPARDRAGGAHRGLAPGDLNRVFFTSGGSEAVESALEARPPVPQAATASRSAPRSSRARSPTTAPPSARSRSPASRRCARPSSRSCRAAATCRTRTTTAGPRAATRSGPPTQIEHGSSSRGRRPSPR